ncbi:MAG: GGDEF domain-containing protein [Woeseiaceae bacterium]|nr:GGDEF domain-containing protein [Woeseiaceae bacterium]
MREQQSGLETWSYIARSQTSRDTTEGFLPLILAGAGALGITPFAVIRYMNGEWLVAIFDTILIIGLVSLGIYVYRTRQVTHAAFVLSFLCIGGVLSTVYLSGPQQVFWAYPALMAVFYLVKPRTAIFFALALVAALIPRLLQSDNVFQTTTTLVTIIVMSAFAYAFSIVTNRQREQLIRLATKDPLTGAGNRRALEGKLREVVSSFRRNRHPASLVILDLDHFKAVNDAHGHAAGDQILRSVTEIVNLRIRVTDSLYRIGGEEFVIVIEGQDIHGAAHLAEQLRTIVEANELVPDRAVTISLGVAQLRDGESGKDWLHRADEALYQAKRDGRNTTGVAG